jgi:PadR family transcriptional regulator, regulatory protein PadR
MGRGRGWAAEDAPRPRRIRRFLEPAILLLLHESPAHGYALIEGLRSLGLESYPTDMSTIYRILYSLEEGGMLVSTQESAPSSGPPRRVYALTERGEDHLSTWVAELRETDRLLHRFLQAYDAHRREHESVDTAVEASTNLDDVERHEEEHE